MAYVDGFVVPVPKKSLDVYRRMARKAGKIWREHGALEFRECIADDVKVGKLTSFPRRWFSPGSPTSRAPIATASTPRS
jgi:uncharacterized protein YbaA (DUF1428 family)